MNTECAAGRLQASSGRIDLWLNYYAEIADEALLARLRRLLSDEERAQEPRFFFADDRRRYLLTRALVRTVLSRYADVAAADWRFSSNAYGRPQIAACHGQAQRLSFNLSHTRGLIALAVSEQRTLGVDVEHLSVRRVSAGIADRFFAPDEVAALQAVAAEHQQQRFFEYWTFKESYIKARGMGLSIPLDRFSFHYPHERGVDLSIEPDLGDDATRWRFWQCRPTPDYLLALCAERSDAPTQISLRRTIPTVSEELLSIGFSRESHRDA